MGYGRLVMGPSAATELVGLFKHQLGFCNLKQGELCIIVTDTGSTKAQVMEWAQEYLPPTVNFIGGHPMTGKETSGLSEAEAGLFEDCVYCLTPTPNTKENASESMVQLVEWVGAKPLFIDTQRHDELVGGVSHLPILLSAALVSTLAQSALWPQMSKLAATGYRDS